MSVRRAVVRKRPGAGRRCYEPIGKYRCDRRRGRAYLRRDARSLTMVSLGPTTLVDRAQPTDETLTGNEFHYDGLISVEIST